MVNQYNKYVVHISVDGLTPHTITKLGKSKLPAFYKLREMGIFTDNARTDSITITLPNHTTMFTSLPSDKHNVKFNENDTTQTIHNINNNKDRVQSIFSFKNIKKAMYVGKDKFMFLDSSYTDKEDCIDKFFLDDCYKVSECFTGKTCIISWKGVSRYRNKCYVGWKYELVQNNSLLPMDEHYIKGGNDHTLPIIKEFITDFENKSYDYYFIHFRGPDSVGHNKGWDTPEYDSSIIGVDQDLRKVLDIIDKMEDTVYVILTSDHGGGGSDKRNHVDDNHQLNFTIPFYVYRNKGYYDNYIERDLYKINNKSRKEPDKNKNPTYDEDRQPIRNGDVGNLVAGIFELGPIEGSTIGNMMDLII